MCTIYSTDSNTCEYGLTSQFAHRWATFHVRRAYSGSCLGGTPIRTSNCHSSIKLTIMIVPLPDHRSIVINIMIVFLLRSIMLTIMIIFLPRNVCVRTIVKAKGYPPMHENTIMHEVPTFFHFHYHLIQPR